MLSTIWLFNRGKYMYANKLYTLNTSLSDLQSQSSLSIMRENVNFENENPLSCSITINVDYNESTYNDDNYTYMNYLLNVTYGTHWFITGISKPCEGQYVYSLIRDVFTDFNSDIIESPAIIKRANQITSVTQLAQYKKTMNLSQIKKGEIVLEEGAGKGWIYVYLAKNAQMISSSGYFMIPKTSNAWNNTVTLTSAMMSDLSKPLIVMNELEAYFRGRRVSGIFPFSTIEKRLYTANSSSCTEVPNDFNETAPFFNMNDGFPTTQSVYEYVRKHYDEYLTYCKGKGDYIINSSYNALVGLNGQVVADTDGKLYTVNVAEYPSREGKYTIVGTEDQAKAMADAFGWTLNGNEALNFNIVGKAYNITFTPVSNTTDFYYRVPIAWINNRATTIDCLYDIMAFPIECNVTTNVLNQDGTGKSTLTLFTSYAETINFVQALKTAMGDSVYDIQWLPYGPFASDASDLYNDNYYNLLTKVTGKATKTTFKNETVETSTTSEDTTTKSGGSQVSVDNTSANQVIDTAVTDESGNLVSHVAWINLTGQNASRTVRKTIATLSNNYLNNRIENEKTFYRLCGPNWNSTFEFSAVNNGGFYGYNIDMTLKPYNPFVRIQPLFGKMYGSNFNDPRGLILKGDFSIEQVTESYRNYQLSNRNYDLIFNRQMQSLDLRNSVSLKMDQYNQAMDTLSIFTGGLRGGAGGAMTGAMVGGAPGAVVGAAVGGLTAVGGGIADLAINNQIRELNKSLRADERSASIAQYQYQLGNIAALPDTLSRSSSFDAMYRVYPVLEIYSCSDEEGIQLTKSIQWNGVEINQISTLGEQLENGTGELYVSAELLRFDAGNDQIYGAISQLLADGIYIERS